MHDLPKRALNQWDRESLFHNNGFRAKKQKDPAQMSTSEHPIIIQGGMGAGISSRRLSVAFAVGATWGRFRNDLGQILVRRLQDGESRRTHAAYWTPFRSLPRPVDLAEMLRA